MKFIDSSSKVCMPTDSTLSPSEITVSSEHILGTEDEAVLDIQEYRDTGEGDLETSSGLTTAGCEGDKGQEITILLPEDVIEKIIALLPFHSLFQARLLAKRWASIILSSGSFETVFKWEIMSNSLSSQWDSYCPVYVGVEGLVGYNLVSESWEKILNISYLPISESEFRGCRLGNIAGALLSFYSPNHERDSDKLDVWVTNPLNQSWSLLHPFSLTKRSKIALVHLEFVGTSAYKLMVVTTDNIHVEGPASDVILGAQVYDSTSRSWTKYHPCTKRIDWVYMVSKWCSAYANDTLYMMGQIVLLQPLLVAYNMKDEIWSTITIFSPQPGRRFWSEAALFPCGDKVVIVNIRQDRDCIVAIYELNYDHDAQIICPCSDGDPVRDRSNTFWRCSQLTASDLPLLFTGNLITSDARALYFCALGDESGLSEEPDVMVFDLHEQVWHSLPHSGALPNQMPFRLRVNYKWGRNAFQPGLNPFVNA